MSHLDRILEETISCVLPEARDTADVLQGDARRLDEGPKEALDDAGELLEYLGSLDLPNGGTVGNVGFVGPFVLVEEDA